MDKQHIKLLSDEIFFKAVNEADFHPIDRYFIDKHDYLNKILETDIKKFVLFNFEIVNSLYSVHLMLCLPEVWQRLSVDDIIDIMKSFTNVFSFYAIIHFTYKYIEIDILDIIFKLDNAYKEDIKDYLINSFYPNLFKNDSDMFLIEEGVYGIDYNDWLYLKQLYLLDDRVQPAASDAYEFLNSRNW